MPSPLFPGAYTSLVATSKKELPRREDDEPFDVTPEQEAALLAAIAEADRGQVVSWKELREQLERFG